MSKINKKTAALCAATALAFSLAGVNVFAANADVPVAEWTGYQIVRDAEQAYVGVNITDDLSGNLSMLVPQGAATYAADTEAGFTGAFAVVTYDLEDFTVGDYTQIAIQLDRRHASANTGPRLFLETSDGLLYKFNEKNSRNDTFIKSDGTKITMQNTSYRYTLTSAVSGTLNVPKRAHVYGRAKYRND